MIHKLVNIVKKCMVGVHFDQAFKCASAQRMVKFGDALAAIVGGLMSRKSNGKTESNGCRSFLRS